MDFLSPELTQLLGSEEPVPYDWTIMELLEKLPTLSDRLMDLLKEEAEYFFWISTCNQFTDDQIDYLKRHNLFEKLVEFIYDEDRVYCYLERLPALLEAQVPDSVIKNLIYHEILCNQKTWALIKGYLPNPKEVLRYLFDRAHSEEWINEIAGQFKIEFLNNELVDEPRIWDQGKLIDDWGFLALEFEGEEERYNSTFQLAGIKQEFLTGGYPITKGKIEALTESEREEFFSLAYHNRIVELVEKGSFESLSRELTVIYKYGNFVGEDSPYEDPIAKAIYSMFDYPITPGTEHRKPGTLWLINKLTKKGISIDMLAEQCHYLLDSNDS